MKRDRDSRETGLMTRGRRKKKRKRERERKPFCG